MYPLLWGGVCAGLILMGLYAVIHFGSSRPSSAVDSKLTKQIPSPAGENYFLGHLLYLLSLDCM